MPSVLYIHAYSGSKDALKRNWPFFKRSGAVEIVGVEPLGCPNVWPEPIRRIQAGEDAYFRQSSPHLIIKFLAGLKDHVKRKAYRNFTSVHCEYDHLTTGKIPEFTGIQMNHCVGKVVGNRGSGGMHLPWGFDHASAKQVWILGNRMVAAGDWENGSPDMWIYWLLEQYGLPWAQSNTFSANGFDHPPTVEAAQRAIAAGAWCVHPCKTGEDFRKINNPCSRPETCP